MHKKLKFVHSQSDFPRKIKFEIAVGGYLALNEDLPLPGRKYSNAIGCAFLQGSTDPPQRSNNQLPTFRPLFSMGNPTDCGHTLIFYAFYEYVLKAYPQWDRFPIK